MQITPVNVMKNCIFSGVEVMKLPLFSWRYVFIDDVTDKFKLMMTTLVMNLMIIYPYLSEYYLVKYNISC